MRQLRWSNTALGSDLAVHYLKERNLLYPRFVAAWLS
jgi:hypothetical protein